MGPSRPETAHRAWPGPGPLASGRLGVFIYEMCSARRPERPWRTQEPRHLALGPLTAPGLVAQWLRHADVAAGPLSPRPHSPSVQKQVTLQTHVSRYSSLVSGPRAQGLGVVHPGTGTAGADEGVQYKFLGRAKTPCEAGLQKAGTAPCGKYPNLPASPLRGEDRPESAFPCRHERLERFDQEKTYGQRALPPRLAGKAGVRAPFSCVQRVATSSGRSVWQWNVNEPQRPSTQRMAMCTRRTPRGPARPALAPGGPCAVRRDLCEGLPHGPPRRSFRKLSEELGWPFLLGV